MELKGLSQVLNLDPLRLLEGQNALSTLLSQVSGADLEAILAGRTADGLLLQLLNGRTVVAGGDLPFPDGTQLVLRAVPAPDQGTLRLQLLQATPPPPSPALLPLEQGEAAALLARVLGAEEVPALLEPLRALLAQAQAEPPSPPQTATAPPPSPTPSGPASAPPSASNPIPAPIPASGPALAPAPVSAEPQPAGATVPSPTPAQPPPPSSASTSAPAAPPALPLLRAWMAQLQPPPEPNASILPRPEDAPDAAKSSRPAPDLLAKALADRGVPPQEAKAWAAFLLDPEGASPPAEGEVLLPGAPEDAVPRAQDAASPLSFRLPRGVLEAVASEPSGRPSLGAVLDELRRAQVPDPLIQRLLPLLALARPIPGGGAIEQLLRALLPQEQAPSASAPPLPQRAGAAALPSEPSPTAAATQPQVQLQAPSPWDAPETWQSWLKEATQALANPNASPREAPFHALQAREGTALFELPLPLPGLRSPVELWVERDREGDGSGERPMRMLVALEFEGMGQVRLGVQRLGGRIRADLWVEEERRPAVARALAEELGDPPPYPMRVLGFQGSQPGLRQAAGAGAFGAMG